VVAVWFVPLANATPGGPPSSRPPTVSVIEHGHADALARSRGTTVVRVHWHSTGAPLYVTAVEWADLADGRQRRLDFDGANRLETETTRSAPITATGPQTERTLTFEYPSKTWLVQTRTVGCSGSRCHGPPDPTAARGCDLDPFTNFYRPALTVSLLGQGQIDGRPTLHLRFVTSVPLPSTIDMWIDRSTYLPRYEKVAFRHIVGTGRQARPVGPTVTTTNDFRWRPGTGANLAHFGIVVPPGFTPAPPLP
jgi:hypothetical protein